MAADHLLPLALTARHARGDVLMVDQHTPSYDAPAIDDVPLADVVATHDPETGEVTVFAVNRSESDTVRLNADLRALPDVRVEEYLVLGGDTSALAQTNAVDQPERVTPSRGFDAEVDSGRVTAALPPVSWTMLRLVPSRPFDDP